MSGPVKPICLSLALLAALAACEATPPEAPVTGRALSSGDRGEPVRESLKRVMGQQARLWNVGYPMLTSNAAQCGNLVRPQFGLVAWTRWDIRPRYRTASMGIYGLDDYLRAVHILSGSPAARAGLQAGDVIEAIGWQEIPVGQEASASLQKILERESRYDKPLTFTVRRGGETLKLEMSPEPQCSFDLLMSESGEVNGFTKGRKIFITDGLMVFAESDEQLAAVIAHLLAHALLGQRPEADEKGVTEEAALWLRELRTSALEPESRAALAEAGVGPDSEPFSTSQEIAADALALRIGDAAGYGPLEAVRLWRRAAAPEPYTTLFGYLHPASPARLEALQDEALDIDIEQAGG